jgi:thiol-disulfide isomerase/thioredoxin
LAGSRRLGTIDLTGFGFDDTIRISNLCIQKQEDLKVFEMKTKTFLILVFVLLAVLTGSIFAEEKKKEGDLEEQLKAAIEKAETAKRKSPWQCLRIVSIYLKMEKAEEAFTWLNKAVEQGFLSYTELYNEDFALLKKDKRFEQIITRIKDKIGIGKPAKDFSITLISGKKFLLSGQKGKVVLIDFWATWCKPCVKGVPHLKIFYEEFKGKGFEIVGISLDSKKEALDEYLAKEKLPWKIAYSGQGWFDETARFYNVNLIPSYWLIDRMGVLRNFGIPLRDKETLKKAIEKLLSE